MKCIKIDGETYEYHDCQCQLTFGSYANLYLAIDINKNPNYKNPIITLYESSKKFDIISTKFISKSNNIKLMDISERFINLEIRAEVLETIPQESSEKKYSYHVIFDGLIFENHLVCKDFFRRMSKNKIKKIKW